MATDGEHDSSSEAFWTLTDEQIDVLRPHGQVQQTQDGEVLFQQGELTCDFYVVLEGEVELIEPTLVTPRVIGVRKPREIVGELNLLTEEVTYLSAVVRKGGSVLAIPADDLRTIVTDDPGFSDFLLRAFLLLRSHLVELGAGLKIVGSHFSPDTRRLRAVRRAQPSPPRLDRRRERPDRGVAPAPVQCPAGRDAGGDLEGRGDPAQSLERRSGAGARDRRRARSGGALRPDRRRLGTGRAGRRRLRRLGRAQDAHRGVGRHRRPGGNGVAHRKLSRLPGRALRGRAGEPGAGAGRQIRRQHRGSPGGRRAAS